MRAALVLGVLLACAEAHADCAVPQWLGTPTGTDVPTRGVLFLHDESLRWSDDAQPVVEITWKGSGSTTISRVEDSVARIEYEGSPGAELTIAPGYYDDSRATYRLGADWRAPSAAPRVLQYWHHQTEWTCSWADTLMIQLDQPAAAVRARWIYYGRAVDYIEALRSDDTKSALALGKIDCGGTSIPPDQLARGGELELYAIRHDGSEVRVLGLPRRISSTELPSREDGLGGAFTLVAAEADRPIQTKVAKSSSHAYGLAALALLALGVLLGWRLRVRAPAIES
jgi:hypothetical protein